MSIVWAECEDPLCSRSAGSIRWDGQTATRLRLPAIATRVVDRKSSCGELNAPTCRHRLARSSSIITVYQGIRTRASRLYASRSPMYVRECTYVFARVRRITSRRKCHRCEIVKSFNIIDVLWIALESWSKIIGKVEPVHLLAHVYHTAGVNVFEKFRSEGFPSTKHA